MKPPSPRALSVWYAEQPPGPYTCHDCGTTGPRHTVQPQHPFYMEGREGLALCPDCITARNVAARAERKRQLDAEPRCEIPGCTRRGAWKMRGVLLCGACKARVQRSHLEEMAGAGCLGLFLVPEYDRADVLRLATEGNP